MSDGETYYKLQATQDGLSPNQAAEKQWLGTDGFEPNGHVIHNSGNKAVILRWNEEVWSQGHYDLAEDLIGESFKVHGAGGQTVAQGPAGLVDFIKVWRTAFPDGKMSVDLLIDEGDLVGVRNTWRGTHLTEFYGIPASGKLISISSIGIDRVEDGKIVEGWGELDLLGLMQELGAGAQEEADERKQLVRRYINEVWNQNKLDVVEELFAEDYVIHSVGQDLPTSYEALKQGVAMAHQTFPDIQMTIERMVADGNKITAYWTTRGTHLGEFMLPDMAEGIPATGNAVEFTEAATFRIANGRLAEAWYAADRLTMMGQMGLGPSPDADEDESYQGNSPVAKEVSHKASFRRFAEEAWNNGNLDVVDEVFAPEYVAHAANDAHSVYGPEGHKEFIAYFRQAFPDVHLTFGDLLAEEDLLVARMKWEGTHMGSYMGIPATGKKIAVDVTGINRFENGQVVEAWGVVDTLGMLQQLGVVPDPDSETVSPTAADPIREANKALIQRLIGEFWNDRVHEVADELVAADCSYPSDVSLADGPQGLKQLARLMFTAFPDLRMVIDKIMADRAYVIAHCVKTGTQQGEFMDVPPTGKRATWNEMILFQIEGNKIKKLWFETDRLSMMQQLGAAPKFS